MKKTAIVLALFSVFSLTSRAQRHEIGLFAGVSYYLGDLNPSGQFGLPNAAYGFSYRYAINPRWAFRTDAHYGKLKGDDKNNKDMKYRNLSFESPLLDMDALMEFNFFEYVSGSEIHRFTPFIFGGFAIFRFNPKAFIEGEWHELQPLGTEGQGTSAFPERKPYALTSFAIPFGVGIKWSLSPSVAMSFEWGMRKTFTDYLDDVSTTYVDPYILASENGPYAMILSNRSFELIPDLFQGSWGNEWGNANQGILPFEYYPRDLATEMKDKQRGNSENKDWYSIAGITLTFKIKGPRAKSCPAYQRHFNYREYYLF